MGSSKIVTSHLATLSVSYAIDKMRIMLFSASQIQLYLHAKSRWLAIREV